MAAYMGAADQLFITADSMSMIAEAISSTRPTVVLQPEKAQPEHRYRDTLQRYDRLGLCRLAELGKPLPSSPSGSAAVKEAREALLDQLAAQLDLSHFQRLN
jgi:mitochondrial fission protein ELM1